MGVLPPPSMARSVQSVSRVDPAVRAGAAHALSEASHLGDCAGRGPLAYWRAMPAPAIVAAPRDEDLMLAYAADDAAAFDALYARHKGAVYRYLLRQCSHAGVVDELFQDVWMSVIRSRASYVPSAKFTTWLYRIAHHRLIDHWRASGPGRARQRGGRTTTRKIRSTPFPPRLTTSPEARATARELSSRLKAACAALPAVQREAFLLHQEGGLELAEIAALTGAGVETIKSRIRYAVAKLRVELGDLQ